MTATPDPARPLVLAIEGLCFAGKTTLARALARRLRTAAFAEYADLITLPPFPPRDITSARTALSAFLAAEAARSRQARASARPLVIFDRSPLSCRAGEPVMAPDVGAGDHPAERFRGDPRIRQRDAGPRLGDAQVRWQDVQLVRGQLRLELDGAGRQAARFA